MTTIFRSEQNPALVIFTLSLLLVTAWIVFSPGLSGPLFFDDEVHLPKLAGTGNGIQTSDDVIRLILPDDGASGRSLAFLSLLLDDNGWPISPATFKRTNLLIHLLNGVLVFAFLRALIRMVDPRSSSVHGEWVSLAASALWVLHPLQLSPVMMVIQRMTLLGGTFSLLALIIYLHGRRIAPQRPWTAAIWLVPVFGTCLVLGIMSKETALMTIVYVSVLELTVLNKNQPSRPKWWPAWSAVFLVLPLVLLGYYLALVFNTMADAFQARAFNLPERLMTESRVMMQYLKVILLPSLTESTPYRDDYIISRGLLDPPQTLLSFGIIILLVSLAFIKRRSWPLLSLAVLWFFLGHVLEGTVLPLEIYFEHRNYLPMLGPVFVLCYGMLTIHPSYRYLTGLGLAAMIGMTGVITWTSAAVWGDAEAIALLWSAERPASARAQERALNYWASRGDWERLHLQLDRATAAQPNNANLPLYRFVVEHCSAPRSASLGASIGTLERVLRTAPLDYGSIAGIQWMLDRNQDGKCQVTNQDIERIFEIYLASPKFSANARAHSNLLTLLARHRRQQGDLNGTISAMDRAYAATPSFLIALDQAYDLITAGLFEDAEHYVDIAAKSSPTSLYEWLTQDAKIKQYRDLLSQFRTQDSIQMHSHSITPDTLTSP